MLVDILVPICAGATAAPLRGTAKDAQNGHSFDDIYFTNRGLYSVANRDEALQCSTAYNGLAIHIDIGRLKMLQENGRWSWNKQERE